MRCLMCEHLSLSHICKACQKNHLTPSLFRRKLPNGIEVLSFYKYEDIKELLHTKHTDLGFYIYTILAKNSFQAFINNFDFDEKLVSIAIDDNVESGYSHTAILNRSLTRRNITPLFNRLRARNRVSYAGKTKAFRLQNPREFQVKKFRQNDVILVDDIITTGSTLTQACAALQREGKEIAFCLTLCDVSNK